jgi:hypothetical protein
VRAQVDRDLTAVSRVDRPLGLIKNLGRHSQGDHFSLQMPSQDIDLEGAIHHGRLQRLRRLLDPEMYSHLFKTAKLGRASSLKNRHPQHLRTEHAWVAAPCIGVTSAASPPQAGATAPPRARAAAPPRARRAWGAPPQARRVGAAAPPPSPASLMDRLMPCTCLRKEKLLDSLFGDRRRWCWGFLGAAVDEVLDRPGFILTRRRSVRRSVTCLGTRVRLGELLPLGHKNHVVTRRRVTVHILFKIPNAQLLL